jgi:hypothetical protein
MNNVIVTGCSYSTQAGIPISYPIVIKGTTDLNVSNLAWPGQSNDTIIRNVKEKIREGVSDTLFICQLTHLHRVSHYCTINKKWLDFQPAIVNVNPTIKDDKVQFEVKSYKEGETKPNNHIDFHGAIGIYGARKWEDVNLASKERLDLLEWYEFYLTHIYDEENTFYELHHKINELTKQVKDSGNDILYIYWPDVQYDYSFFTKNNFLSINGEYSMLKWSIQKRLTQQNDTHLTREGVLEMSKEICKHLNVPYTPFIDPLI